jgi:hypothetical protein
VNRSDWTLPEQALGPNFMSPIDGSEGGMHMWRVLMVTNTYFDHQHSTQNQGKTTSHVSYYVYKSPSSTCT